MRYQISKQLDLWHEFDGTISKPMELARHLEINRANASVIVEAIAKDFETNVEPIREILHQGYQQQESLAAEDGWDETFGETRLDLTIEIPLEWVVFMYSPERWDALSRVLNWIEISEKLKADFTDKLLTGCFSLIEPGVFGDKVQEALKLLETQMDAFQRADVIATTAPLVASWMRETIESRGEALALYATLKLIIYDSHQ